jgi:hypothetical protein
VREQCLFTAPIPVLDMGESTAFSEAGLSATSKPTNTSIEQYMRHTLALDADARDAIVYLVSNASALVDDTLARLPDVASEVGRLEGSVCCVFEPRLIRCVTRLCDRQFCR